MKTQELITAIPPSSMNVDVGRTLVLYIGAIDTVANEFVMGTGTLVVGSKYIEYCNS